MLHEALAAYLDRVEQAVLQCNNAYTERYTEEILAPDRVNLRIRLRFDQGHLLEINEAIVVIENNPTSLDYRYHCQDKQNRLIFRYDNTCPKQEKVVVLPFITLKGCQNLFWQRGIKIIWHNETPSIQPQASLAIG